ncbi:MAG: hypothetical protein ACI9XU_001066 [Arenicella sp.]|jgi:hypothetical protein
MRKTHSAHPILNLVMILVICGSLSACIGTVVGVVVDTAIEVVKVPFKVGRAVIDVATPDKKSKGSKSGQDDDEG